MSYKLETVLSGHEHSISSVRFSPEGTYLASSSADRTCRIWNVDPASGKYGQCILVLRGHDRGVNDCCWSPLDPNGQDYSGRYLCTASDDKTLKIWELTLTEGKESAKEVSSLKKHEHYVSCCAWSPRGNLIASGSFDETVLFWSVNDGGSPIRALPAHSDPVTGVAFCPDGSLLASASLDGLCRVWNVDTGHCLRTIMPYASAGSTPPALSSVLYPSSNYLVLISMDGCLWMYDYQRKEFVRKYSGVQNKAHILVPTIALLKAQGRRQLIVSGSEDKRILVWDVNSPAKNQQHVQVIEGRGEGEEGGEGHRGIPICVNAFADRLASGGKEPDLQVRIWKWQE